MILPGGLAVLGSQVLAQSGSGGGAGASKSPEERIQVDVHLVNVLFTARDKKGNLVPNLTRDRVRVFEDGRPQTITNFSRESNQPLAVVLLMDSSSSARASLKVQQEAAIDFFHNTIKRKRDKGMLMTFDSTIDVLQDFVDDPDRLSKAVKSVRIGGGTKMYDAIQVACQEKLAGPSGPRRILVLIGDGDDNMSYETFDSAIAVAQRSEVSIYTISTNNSGFFGMAQPKQDKLLKRLAEATGGRAYFPPKIDDLAMSFYRISEELRSQYSVAYRSTNSSRDGAFRRIKINVKGKKVKLQYRKGYYAPTS
ncbi:MAG: VWA domain-containing protein [Acidobacteria bacterium]|nr:VWA domain-containing protein [Acidobacteriota bacterium]